MAVKPVRAIGVDTCDEDALNHPIFVHGADISGEVPGWNQGIEWPAADCVTAKLSGSCFADPCADPDPDAEPEVIVPCKAPCDLRLSAPFTVYSAVENCGIETAGQLEDMARVAVNKDFGRRVARALVTGFGGLAEIATSIAGADPVSLGIGVGLLSQNRVGCTWYSVPETIMPILVMQGLVTYGADGAPTMLGQPVIPVPTNTAPTGESAADGYWIYGHGPVEYAVDVVARTRNSGATGARQNDRCGIAERDAMIRVDPCRVFAVKVTLPDC